MTSVPWMSAVSFPVLYSGSRFGTKPAPGGSALFCFGFAALRVTVSSFAGPSANAELGTWEPGPLAGFAMCDPSRIREINETEITIMYQNKVTLIGFLGNDAEVRTNDNRSFTTMSLATKSSYKKDGKYISHTEWHRCIVFGKLGEFAGTLTKGAHLQVKGELRSREYETKKVGKKAAQKTIWEIRVNSISSWTGPRKEARKTRRMKTLRRRKWPSRPLPYPSTGSSGQTGLPSPSEACDEHTNSPWFPNPLLPFR